MQQWGWVGSAAAPSCAVGTGVLDSVLLLPPCTPGLWLQVKGKWHSHAGKICGALASEGGKGSLSQFLLKGWGRGSCAVMQVGGGGGCQAAGGAADLPGSMWESARAGPVPPSLPGWVLASPRGYWSTCSPARSFSPPWGAVCAAALGDCPSGVVGLPLALGGLLSLPGDG